MDRNKIFISYPTDDSLIANAVNQAVLKMPEGRLDTFLDRETIGGGEDIPDAIWAALRETIYFVGIATNVTRRSFEWCGIEHGFYRGSHNDPNRRECCLYHISFPSIFNNSKNFKIQSLAHEQRAHFSDKVVPVAECAVYYFLADLAKLNAELHPPQNPIKYYEDVPSWCRTHATLITKAFYNTLQTRVEDSWYPQGRINITVENGDFYKTKPTFPNDAEATLSPIVYNIFSIGTPDNIKPLLFKDFKSLLFDAAGNDILSNMISDIAISALPSRADAKGDYVYQAPNQLFYRVLLVKHSVYGSRRREFTFNLIKTLEKVQSGSRTTTSLVAGIVLGSKYRSLFLENKSKYTIERMKGLRRKVALDVINELLLDLDRIHADAASDGLANHESLQILLGDDPQTELLFKEWWTIFPQMEAAAKDFVSEKNESAYDAFLLKYEIFIKASAKNNSHFLKLCLDAYKAQLSL